MLRTIMALVTVAVFCLGGVNAGGKKEGDKDGDKKEAKKERERQPGKRVIAVFISAETKGDKDTITFKTKDGETKTLRVVEKAKFWGEDRKAESIEELVKDMEAEKKGERQIIIFTNEAGNEILAVGDLRENGQFRSRGDGDKGNRRPVFAIFISVDKTKTPATITFRTKGEKQQTLPISEKAKFYGEDRKAESLDELISDMKAEPEKERRIMIFEDEGGAHVVGIGDLPERGDFPKKGDGPKKGPRDDDERKKDKDNG